jgi:hypothetical protein
MKPLAFVLSFSYIDLMSSGGSIQAMITAMKNNARRRKTSDKSFVGTEAGALYNPDKSKTPKHTPEQIAAAKAAFKLVAKKEATKRKMVLISVIIATPLVCWLLMEVLDFLTS